MTATAQNILDKVIGNFGIDRLLAAVVYLDCTPVRSGEHIHAGDIRLEAPWDAHIAFIDLEPQRSCGHDCCYLAIRRDGDEVIRIETNMPSFLRDGKSSFRLLWHGPLAPEWAKVADYNLTTVTAGINEPLGKDGMVFK